MARHDDDWGIVSPEDKKKVTGNRLREAIGVFRFAKPYWGYFAAGMVFLVLSTGSTLLFPHFLGQLVDSAMPTSLLSMGNTTQLNEQLRGVTHLSPEKINSVALTLLAILAVQSVFSFLRIWTFAQVSERSMADIRLALYRKLVSLPVPFFESRRVGELTSRMSSDVSQLSDVFSFTLAELLRGLVTLIVGIAILVVQVSGKLTLYMAATFPVMILIAMVFGKFIRKMSKNAQDQLAQTSVVVEETLQNINTVKSFTNESLEVGRYSSALKKTVAMALKSASYRGWFVSFIFMALFGSIVFVIWRGAHMINTGELTTGELFEFILYTAFIGGSVAGLGDLYGQIQKTLGASERIRELLDESTEDVALEALAQPVQRLRGDIALEHVHFTYPARPDIAVLKGISLDIKAGEKVALVGQSGAGKSTIAQLLLSFYPVQEGVVRIDGKPSTKYDLPTLRGNVGIVPQEVMLFGGSIRENIQYGRPGASDAEVIAAAKQANAWEFISGFPEGLDTLVGERGVKLSGGQRQRIAIARAILRNPAILILDEATSSLDSESEKLVQEALNHLMEGRTTLIIAHRLSTIRQVDKICVVEDGVIAESGSHDELINRPNGLYAKFVALSQWEMA